MASMLDSPALDASDVILTQDHAEPGGHHDAPTAPGCNTPELRPSLEQSHDGSPRTEGRQIAPAGKHRNSNTFSSRDRIEDSRGSSEVRRSRSHPKMVQLQNSASSSSIHTDSRKSFSASIKSLGSMFTGSRSQRSAAMKKSTPFGLTAQTLARVESFRIPVDDIVLEHKIGEGMIGDVYQGTMKGAPVAIKQLRDAFSPQSNEMKDLVTELNMLSKDIRHPSIINFFGVALNDNHIMLIMELMEGGSLEDYFMLRQAGSRRFRVRPARALLWCTHMFAGVDFLHQHDPVIVHRDLKPANLMLTADLKRLKIGDFGLARTVIGDSPFANSGRSWSIPDASLHQRVDLSTASSPSDAPDALGRRQSLLGRGRRVSMTTFTGTPRYMAPEIANGAVDYTEKVDIYSGALLMFFIFAGERPWDTYDGMVAAALAKSGSRPPLRPDVFAAEMRTIISECWDPNPLIRPSSSEVLQRLQAQTPKAGCLACMAR